MRFVLRWRVLAASLVAMVVFGWGAPGAGQPIPEPVPAATPVPLAVRVTSPQMNAEVSAGGGIVLTAAVTPPDGAIARIEFFDDNLPVGVATQAPFTLTYRPAAAKLNFRITARATDAAGHVAVSPPVTCVAAGTVRRPMKSYTYTETAEDALRHVTVTIPDGVTTVRGILVINVMGYNEAWFREFMILHDFAFLGADFTSHEVHVPVMQHALAQIAKDSGHPELVNAPYVTTGFSRGGGFASRLLVAVPDRVIACVPISSRLNFTGMTPTAAHWQIPACIISGEHDAGDFVAFVEPVLQAYRPQGALYGWVTLQGGTHQLTDQYALALPYLDTAIRLRYPADGDTRNGPVALKTLDPASGWVADNTTWKSGLLSIVPAKQFKGAIEKSSWLPTEELAFIFRAYGTYDKPLTITSPLTSWGKERAWEPGSNVTIVVDDAKFAGWTKLAFYDGARKLGEIAQGPPQFTATNLATGFHAFSVLGTNAKGETRPSNPVLVVVRKMPGK